MMLRLHEHTMYTIGSKGSPAFQRQLEDQSAHLNSDARFNGVWSLLYIQEAYTYLKRKAPHMKLVISGWGGDVQLPHILKGLDVLLPRDITSSCLNPGQGVRVHDQTLADIATRRPGHRSSRDVPSSIPEQGQTVSHGIERGLEVDAARSLGSTSGKGPVQSEGRSA